MKKQNKMIGRRAKNLFAVLGLWYRYEPVLALICYSAICLCGCGRGDGGIVLDTSADISQEGTVDQSDETVKETVAEAESVASEELPQTCYVYVCGAVVTPGVYEMDAGARLCDVIASANGMTKEAEETSFNQAAEVYDGMMLVIPTMDEWRKGEFVPGENGLPVRAQDIQRSAGDVSVTERQDELLNINQATADQLCTLPGVGKAKAESILAYRQEHGVFQSIEEIKNVTGIGDGLFEKIRSKIKV